MEDEEPKPNFIVKVAIFDDKLTVDEFIEMLDKFFNDMDIPYWRTKEVSNW